MQSLSPSPAEPETTPSQMAAATLLQRRAIRHSLIELAKFCGFAPAAIKDC